MIMVTIMLTWHKGRELVFDNLKSHLIPLPDFLKSLLDTSLRRPRDGCLLQG
jgi:KUP system potassium uptake protein